MIGNQVISATTSLLKQGVIGRKKRSRILRDFQICGHRIARIAVDQDADTPKYFYGPKAG